MYSSVTIVNNTVLHIWKLLRVDLKSSHHKKKILLKLGMVTDTNKTSCDEHFTVSTNISSLCCTPETNIIDTSIIPPVKYIFAVFSQFSLPTLMCDGMGKARLWGSSFGEKEREEDSKGIKATSNKEEKEPAF